MKNNLNIARIFLIVCNFICLLLLILSVNSPWLIVISTGSLVILNLGLFFGQADTTTLLFLVLLSAFLSGVICGISIMVVVVEKKWKN